MLGPGSSATAKQMSNTGSLEDTGGTVEKKGARLIRLNAEVLRMGEHQCSKVPGSSAKKGGQLG